MQERKRIRLDEGAQHKRLDRFDALVAGLRSARESNASIYSTPKTRLETVLASMDSENDLETGHMIMDAIRDCTAIVDDRMSEIIPGFERSRDQRIVHDKIIAAVAKFVYNKAYGPNELKIKKYNRLKSTKSAISFNAPRRLGKSSILAIVSAVLFVSVPKMEISIITQNPRAADNKTGILVFIKTILAGCFGIHSLDVDEKEHLIAHLPDRRAIHAYSAGVGDG
jgi:hypothetical protein